MSLDLDVRGQQEIDVFTGERFIVDYWYFSWKQLFEDKIWSGVDYCDVFISCLDSHSDGTHSLQSIHWWVSDVMLQFSKSVPRTNKLFEWNVPLTCLDEFKACIFITQNCFSSTLLNEWVWVLQTDNRYRDCVHLLNQYCAVWWSCNNKPRLQYQTDALERNLCRL